MNLPLELIEKVTPVNAEMIDVEMATVTVDLLQRALNWIASAPPPPGASAGDCTEILGDLSLYLNASRKINANTGPPPEPPHAIPPAPPEPPNPDEPSLPDGSSARVGPYNGSSLARQPESEADND